MYKHLFILTLCILVMSPMRLDAGEPSREQIVYIPNYEPGTTNIYQYVVTLLNLAMALTEPEFGQVQIVANPIPTPQQRQFLNLRNGQTDIMWTVTTFAREEEHTVIRVPLTGGMFGYRIMLIKEGDERFNELMKLSELKQLSAVQGNDWPDTEILRHHGFNVTPSKYTSAFKLLDRGMVDYFPRAVHEIFEEISTHHSLNLTTEKHIVLQYDNPMFFFVTAHRPELAKRLEIGLTRLYQNGDLQRLLTSQHFYIQARNLLQGRTIYSLSNPLLSEQTQQALKRYQSPLASGL